jgi:ABC-type amino acid transport substrate-binding protein
MNISTTNRTPVRFSWSALGGFALAGICGALISLALMWMSPGGVAVQPRESAYQRVIGSGKLRAGFVSYPPGCVKNTRTGKVSGIFVEILDKVGANIGLPVEYTEEVGWGTMIQGLDAGRYDIIGSPVWANSTRGKLATLSEPVYYTGIGIWVRADENRLTSENYLAAINDPEIRVAAMDGSTPLAIAKTQFPRARLISYPDLTGEPQLFLDLMANKADVFFAEPAVAAEFLKNNPGKIKNIATRRPIRTFGNVFMMAKNEPQFKWMIDNAIRDLQASGFVEEVIRRHEPVPNAFLRAARPYQEPTGD